MRAIIQRVSSASVTVDNQIVSSISRGLMVLIGISKDDTDADTAVIVNKVLNLRVFDDDQGTMWKSSVKDINGEILCVSQFTLYGNTTKGNKPDFHNAMSAQTSSSMYATVLQEMRSRYIPDRIKDGKFGAMMGVQLTNEGPVTLTVDSRKPGDSAPLEQKSSGTNELKAARKQKYEQKKSSHVTDLEQPEQ